MDRRHFLGGIASGVGAVALWQLLPGEAEAAYAYTLTDAQWRKKLTKQEFAVLREAATERPYSSPLNDEKRAGTFVCAGCGNGVYSSKTKYDSKTGWPSFWKPVADDALETKGDFGLFMLRTEVLCPGCDAHLGHVFENGPEPTGLRYCINGVCITREDAK